MARKIKLTDARIGRLKSRGCRVHHLGHPPIAGFGVRIRPSGYGRATCITATAEGQSRKFTLGPVALGSVDEAQTRMHGGLEQDAIGGAGRRYARDAQAPLFPELRRGVVESGVL